MKILRKKSVSGKEIANNFNTGNFGESIAANYLRKKGYKIIDRNYRNKIGEIDIIGKSGKTIVFFEVKTSLKNEDYFPEDRVDKRKREKLRRLAQAYLFEKKIGLENEYQIDIIAVRILGGGNFEIKHIENAVEDNW